MKRIIYLFAAAALCTACKQQPGYTITGTVDGGENGDTLVLKTIENNELVDIDTAYIENGTFKFEGRQDSAKYSIISLQNAGKNPIFIDFYLENGPIKVNISDGENDQLSGTPLNEKYKAVQDKNLAISLQIEKLAKEVNFDSLSESEKAEKIAEFEKLSDQLEDMYKQETVQNIDNPIGIDMLKKNYRFWDSKFLGEVLAKVPAKYANSPAIQKIKEMNEKMQKTAVGQQYTDFELQTPEGKAVKLSDFVGKYKLVMVDFWASWCGPCRREMPNMVDLYKEYKNKGFEIAGVSLDNDAEAWKDAVKKLNITWPQMSDLKGWKNEAAELYSVHSIPHTVLINQEGVIVARGLVGKDLQEKVAELMK